jgi:hypothetical protein
MVDASLRTPCGLLAFGISRASQGSAARCSAPAAGGEGLRDGRQRFGQIAD